LKLVRKPFKSASSAGREDTGYDTAEDAAMMSSLISIALAGGLLWGTGYGVNYAAHEVATAIRDRSHSDDLQNIQGAWRGLAIEIKGNLLTPPSARSMRIRFDKDTFTIEQGGKITAQGRFTIDTSHNPGTIDLNITNTVQTVNTGALVLGVYSVQKDRLRLCTTAANGQDRPKKLVSKLGSTHTLFTFQKEKP
jgi:uncharacterized protein (TIGR03067 family)